MLEVVRPGVMLTVQDRGRTGLRHAGVSSAGPMDAAAFALANALVANDPGAAALEFAGIGGLFRAHAACRIAVTGGTPEMSIDGLRIGPDAAHRLAPGQVLTIGAMGGSVWGYLAVSGGIDCPPTLGSSATHLRSGLGGLDGGTVPAGAMLPIGPFDPRVPCLEPYPVAAPPWPVKDIRVVLGPQQDAFPPETWALLLSQPFTVTPARDRMAMTLDGPPLRARSHDIVSDGTVAGSIQVPGSGRPLVLMAESQTTGGYPKIATVIGADLGRLAQVVTGGTVRFRAIDRDAAERVWIAHAQALRARLHPLRVRIARRD
ncbi:biotin-dependent carboxyltransferase family protein [Cereibacter sp. SYSU M97828]|nr:biotin-dependent carboxyltransferase family protein [Cereibacter flavus]